MIQTAAFKPLGNPILLVSDSPELHSGLGRIGRDLATLLCSLPEFRVGYAGMGGSGLRKLPCMQYQFPNNGQWGSDLLPRFWHDFAAGQPGVILSLWDLSRLAWFGNPATIAQASPEIADFAGPGRTFAKWGYVPVDGQGVTDGLPLAMRATAAGFDRLAAASEWGHEVFTSSALDSDWLPHGIWMDKFRHYPDAKSLVGWDEHAIVCGCVMTNQARKDWPVAFQAAQILRGTYGSKFKFWAHTDSMVQYWNLFSLAADFGIGDCLEVTLELSDEQMALRYSACDVTILPSSSEGFGFPIAESMACGTACVVTDYAAGQELVDEPCKVPAVAFRIDTLHNVRRAVLSGYGFAARAQARIEAKLADPEGERTRVQTRVEHLNWNKLQYPWKKWLLKGIGR